MGEIVDTVTLIYGLCAVTACSDKLIDIIALGKCEVHYKKSQYSLFHYNCIFILSE